MVGAPNWKFDGTYAYGLGAPSGPTFPAYVELYVATAVVSAPLPHEYPKQLNWRPGTKVEIAVPAAFGSPVPRMSPEMYAVSGPRVRIDELMAKLKPHGSDTVPAILRF